MQRAQETLDCIVESVKFHSADSGYTVLDVNAGGELVTAVGNFYEVGPGEELRLYGAWSNHAVFGRQFRVESFESKLPDSAASLLRYLSAGMIKGIGPKTARRIIERFGENAFEVLEKDYERLTFIKGISKEKAKAISDEFNRQFSIRNIMAELDQYGIKPAECIRIFKRFGGSAVEIVKRNPYILCDEIRGFDFKRADDIAAKLPETPEPRYRNEAGILYVMRHNLGNGHTCIPAEKLLPPCCALLDAEQAVIGAHLRDLIACRMLVASEIGGREFVFLPEVFDNEFSAAQRLYFLMKYPPVTRDAPDAIIDAIERENNIRYAAEQRNAIKIAAANGIVIITGGPGTGKTTTVKGIISFFQKRNMHVLLTAPTGRAAKRMSELTGMEAKTLHRLLEVAWSDDDTPVFTRDTQHPLDADAVIVDELSMVDITLFSALLKAIPFGCRLILVGDCDQLPPVGAGNVLLDAVNSGIIPVVRLTEIFRQAQKSLIVMNSHAILRGEMPVLDAKDNDFFFIERNSPLTVASLVCDLMCTRLPDAYHYDPVADIQVLCPSKKGDCGTVNLNIRLQKLLNPPAGEKPEISSFGRVLRTGDKIMQIKNNYDIEWSKGSEKGMGIFNGDMGIIRNIDRRAGMLELDFDGRIAMYPTESLADIELAHAVTVHKSQGSEYPAVILPISDAPPQLMYRNLLYTAVTRAKKLLIIVGSRHKLQLMVENNKKNRRYSALKSFIDEAAEQKTD
ncbi:MAG: ATP-dependent RecD-like DNA helicase [Clostridia bacterium]|nr:ATP-dependent RecD-like DNA helicase [Clostridia bacterium]